MFAPLPMVPGCNSTGGPVSEASVGKVWFGRWVVVEVWLLMSGWGLVVDVGLGGWCFGSKSSVEGGSRDMVVTRWRLVGVVSKVWVGVRGCTFFLVFR